MRLLDLGSGRHPNLKCLVTERQIVVAVIDPVTYFSVLDSRGWCSVIDQSRSKTSRLGNSDIPESTPSFLWQKPIWEATAASKIQK